MTHTDRVNSGCRTRLKTAAYIAAGTVVGALLAVALVVSPLSWPMKFAVYALASVVALRCTPVKVAR